MNRIARVRLLMAPLLALALLGSVAATGLAAPPDGTFERVIVVLHDGAGSPGAVVDEVARRYNGRRGFVYEHALQGFVVEVPARAVAGIARDPRVASIEPDQRVWAFDVPTGVNRIEADKNDPVPAAHPDV